MRLQLDESTTPQPATSDPVSNDILSLDVPSAFSTQTTSGIVINEPWLTAEDQKDLSMLVELANRNPVGADNEFSFLNDNDGSEEISLLETSSGESFLINL
jgi:hypothetical protein